MNECIIVYRVNGGRPEAVITDDEDLCVYRNRDEAIAYALNNSLFASGQADYQIVELDEI